MFSSNKVVRNMFIDLPGLKVSDNYFDIVPGYPVKVTILDGKNTYESIRSSAKFISVREASIKD